MHSIFLKFLHLLFHSSVLIHLHYICFLLHIFHILRFVVWHFLVLHLLFRYLPCLLLYLLLFFGLYIRFHRLLCLCLLHYLFHFLKLGLIFLCRMFFFLPRYHQGNLHSIQLVLVFLLFYIFLRLFLCSIAIHLKGMCCLVVLPFVLHFLLYSLYMVCIGLYYYPIHIF